MLCAPYVEGSAVHAGLSLEFDLEVSVCLIFFLQGVIELLDRSGVEISGKKAVVVGRSNIVGMPVAMLLTGRDATVTVTHSKTPNLPELVSAADILVAAIGKPEFVKGAWIKEGAAVIDVGTNAVDVSFSPCFTLKILDILQRRDHVHTSAGPQKLVNCVLFRRTDFILLVTYLASVY